MGVKTNPIVSRIHAANFQKEIAKAISIVELAAAAERHSRFLLGGDKERCRNAYKARLAQLKA